MITSQLDVQFEKSQLLQDLQLFQNEISIYKVDEFMLYNAINGNEVLFFTKSHMF